MKMQITIILWRRYQSAPFPLLYVSTQSCLQTNTQTFVRKLGLQVVGIWGQKGCVFDGHGLRMPCHVIYPPYLTCLLLILYFLGDVDAGGRQVGRQVGTFVLGYMVTSTRTFEGLRIHRGLNSQLGWVGIEVQRVCSQMQIYWSGKSW